MKYTINEILHFNYAKIFYGKYRKNPFAAVYYKSRSRSSLKKLINGSRLVPMRSCNTNEVDQLTHPDGFVASEKFNGRILMTASGYPFGSERDESQYVLSSEDGISFKNLVGEGPVAEYTGNGRSHFSDGEIIEENGKIYVYYRYCDVDSKEREITIYRKETKDLRNWTNEICVLSKKGQAYISPAIVKSGNLYHMYYVEEEPNDDMMLKRLISSNLEFSDSTEETLRIDNNPQGMKLWHVDIVREGDVLHGLFVYTIDKGGKGARLYYARSTDDGLTWCVHKEIRLDVNYSCVSRIYRSTMIKIDKKWNLYVPVNTVDECWFVLVMEDFDYEAYT